jgi:hypothetical protein
MNDIMTAHNLPVTPEGYHDRSQFAGYTRRIHDRSQFAGNTR